MAASAFLMIAVFLLVLFALALPLGRLLARLIDGEPFVALRGVENGFWRCCGIQPQEMSWLQYLLAIIAFNLLGILLLFALLMAQGILAAKPTADAGDVLAPRA